MDEYKQYYYSARPSAQGKAFGRFVFMFCTVNATNRKEKRCINFSISIFLSSLFFRSGFSFLHLVCLFVFLQYCRSFNSAAETELQTFPLVHGERLP